MMRCAALPSPLGPVVLGLRRSGFVPTPCVSQGEGTTSRLTGTVHSRPGTVWLDELSASL